VFGAKGKSNHY